MTLSSEERARLHREIRNIIEGNLYTVNGVITGAGSATYEIVLWLEETGRIREGSNDAV